MTLTDIAYDQLQVAMDEVPWRLYFAGLFGNAAVEFTSMTKATLAHNGNCPELYRKPFYVAARATFAVVFAAPLPILLGAASILSAFYIGASAPVIFDKLASGILPESKNGGGSS